MWWPASGSWLWLGSFFIRDQLVVPIDHPCFLATQTLDPLFDRNICNRLAGPLPSKKDDGTYTCFLFDSFFGAPTKHISAYFWKTMFKFLQYLKYC